MNRITFARFTAFVTALALCVIVFGAYVRLSDAGLGCPDWPGCYGQLVAPTSQSAIDKANEVHPARPVHTAKAWKEMVHRYLAGSLGLAICTVAVMAWRGRRRGLPVVLPTMLVAIVVFQALLGMWTVTLLVNPAIVTLHLAGGMTTLALSWWLSLRQGRWFVPSPIQFSRLRPWVVIGLGLVVLQILLGGWTSTNYAAMACPEFPTCHSNSWWPAANFSEGFVLWRPFGVNYEFGILDSPARTAIHLAHRLGALTVLLYVATLAVVFIRVARLAVHRRLGGAVLVILLVQIGLGITNVLAQLPLMVAVAHNGGAALLLLAVVSLLHLVSRANSHDEEGRSQ
ncbi:cytochrome c oxidase assembly protein subunit 15 [Gammaproteobacteria bacterium]